MRALFIGGKDGGGGGAKVEACPLVIVRHSTLVAAASMRFRKIVCLCWKGREWASKPLLYKRGGGVRSEAEPGPTTRLFGDTVGCYPNAASNGTPAGRLDAGRPLDSCTVSTASNATQGLFTASSGCETHGRRRGRPCRASCAHTDPLQASRAPRTQTYTHALFAQTADIVSASQAVVQETRVQTDPAKILVKPIWNCKHGNWRSKAVGTEFLNTG